MTLTGKTIVAASTGAEQKEAPSAKKASRDGEQIYVRARDGEEVMMSREVARLAGHLKDLMDDASSEGSVYPAPMVAASTLRSLVRMSELLGDGADWEACPPKLDKLFADLLALERCTYADYDRATDAIASGTKTEAELISEWAPMGLNIGALVKIKNLKSRPELNGCEATVIDLRYGLQLSGGEGEKIAVKPDNMQEVGGMDAAPAASADEHSLLQLMEHVEGALFLDAPMLLMHTQSVIASLVNGKSADELRALLGAGSDFDGTELEAALAESAFLPEGYEAPRQLGAANSTSPLAPLRQPSLSGVPATNDAREAALGMVDMATLCELKGVNRFWRALSRRVLCSRLCRGRGQPAPTHLEEITDLDVELLIEAGRPGDTALAGRMLPGLARLHGYGFVVDVAKVRAANLGVQEANPFGGRLFGGFGAPNPFGAPIPFGGLHGAASPPPPSLLRVTAKAALDRCISGDGEAPLRLTIAAVACAGSGVVCGIPVQHMREDTMTELDLRRKGLCGPVAMLLSYLIPAMGGLTRVDVRFNNAFAGDGAAQLSAAVLGNLKIEMFNEIPIKEMRADTFTGLDLMGKYIGVEGGLVVAGLIPVMGSLTSLNLYQNKLCGLDNDGRGTYTADGITAIADALRVNGSLTSLDVSKNRLGAEGAAALAPALAANGSLTSINLSENNLTNYGRDMTGITELAAALGVNGSLTELSIYGNQVGDEGVCAICEAIQSNKETKLTSLNFGRNGVGPVGANAVAAMVAVTGSLTSVDVGWNRITGNVAQELATVVLSKPTLEIFCNIPIKKLRADSLSELDLSGKGVGLPGALVLANLLPVIGSLTKIE